MQIAGVIRFEPRRGVGPKAEGVKSTHILPFVPNFAAMVVRLEALQESAQVVKPEAFLAEGDSSRLLSLAFPSHPNVIKPQTSAHPIPLQA